MKMAGTTKNEVCGSVSERGDDYNMALHISAIFIIFGVSISGALLPVISKRVACMKKSETIMKCLNAFGIGVVLATSLIHMIPPAMDTLNNPCLNLNYNGLAMVVVLATIFFMQFMESELVILLSKQHQPENTDQESGKMSAISEFNQVDSPIAQVSHAHVHGHHAHAPLGNQEIRAKITVLIFEIGVAIHSVLIGVDLGVTSGTEFSTLLIAICFHQFFEGVAVGTSAVTAFDSLKASILTAGGYSLTTPIGIAIGIATSTSYAPTSTSALWVRGILDSIAGGVLLYTGIVELLTYQFTINPVFHDKSKFMRGITYFSLYLGSAAMAIIGKWT